MLGCCAAIVITDCRQGASFACCEVGWGGCRCGVGLVVAQSYVLEFFEVLSAMRRGSLFVFVLQCANRLFGCGVRVSRQIVRFLGVVKRRRSRVCAVCAVCLSAQRSSPALYVLCRAMLESGRSFDRVSVSLHMLWGVMKANSTFVLCAHVYRVPPVL